MENGILTDNILKEGQAPELSLTLRLKRLENFIYILLIIWFVSAIMLVYFTPEGNILMSNVATGIKKSTHQKKTMDFLAGKENSAAQHYMNRGWKCFLDGKDSQAMLYCSLALRENPRYAPAYALKSCIYEEMGRPEMAVCEMDKAIRFDPARRDIYIAIRQNIRDRSEQSATL